MPTPNARLTAQGYELKHGMFEVTPGISGLRLQRAAYSQVKKFVVHYLKLGYTLFGKPHYELIPPWDVRYRFAGAEGDILKWVPVSKGMSPNHPWYVPDADQYQCWAWFWKRPEQRQVWLPDSYVAKHGMPVGFKEV